MMTDDAKTQISDAIEELFANLSIEDVAEILTIQLAALIAQGSSSKEDAQDFLDDIRQDVASYLDDMDYEAMAAGDEEEDAPPVTPSHH
ncbi:hypothetical protein [Aureimonas psammosilenae]|uniref:hypothetical protein n=1 Tax=Aureimonas psammosilenae TaxID=2495496 RepID=UPI001260748B|nr:hypothetical protein [Aureimonas psammosilenae]